MTGAWTLKTRIDLNQGHRIPVVGLGVFQTEPGPTTRNAVAWALEEGYRHIDTAAMYGNEADVGAAVRASGLPRDEVFVTTKLWHTDQGFEPAFRACEKSLERLGLGYIDLYLIHWPQAKSPEERTGSWHALSKLLESGTCRSVGVSNYSVRHLEELLRHSSLVPAVNQVEMHPFVYDPDLLQFCQRRGIRVEAYSPLTRGRSLDHPVFAEVAAAHQRTPAQVLIRWGLQHGLIELPKSVHRERIHENAQVFDFTLTADEMARLNGLKGQAPRVTAWDPAKIP